MCGSWDSQLLLVMIRHGTYACGFGRCVGSHVLTACLCHSGTRRTSAFATCASCVYSIYLVAALLLLQAVIVAAAGTCATLG
jgi:hypothetical protein